MAAGAGRRFEGAVHKLLVPFRGQPLIRWTLEAVGGSGLAPLYVVTGAADVAAEVEAVLGLARPDTSLGGCGRARLVANPRWAEGQATSLAAAVAAARADGCRAMVVGLGDQPLIPAEAWRAVAAANGPIVTATFDGRRGPPVKFESTVWDQLPDSGDEGARRLLRERPELVSELPCSGNPMDIDTLEDLRRWS